MTLRQHFEKELADLKFNNNEIEEIMDAAVASSSTPLQEICNWHDPVESTTILDTFKVIVYEELDTWLLHNKPLHYKRQLFVFDWMPAYLRESPEDIAAMSANPYLFEVNH